ncbi:hypothetical protein GTA62_14780 [Roseobacter sp. HKCCD9010]|uniref:hypothetical protein n=1 Tax=unclassified Roseobacter TaxID=196798 RepID=UPI001490C17D|nr:MULTISPECIES: hypothetical protein [unclassified Roseobacter]MBF9050624.1 hypothetical protein [Rhodobacterales bacterium HKCCD4356]NNV11958.1 hypothetical protein [Roseobacter sp. HKCCD7357]NNV16971.1 hypothetical protein [Roseobacter sp. HKCCD8768]NNV26200.1 hypothetical protein [Roseobacter sp. HKCCD8192]NNV30695.1 hypothetical protein [Roseobacter sp. HKCCD9061]
MKVLASLAAAFCLCSPAAAETGRDALCAGLGSLAATIMTQRQNQTPISTLIQALEGSSPSEDNAPPWHEMTRAMILEAYETPYFHTEEMQQRAVANFQNEIELACFTGALGSE